MLVVVAIGREVYGATGLNPLAALHAAAKRASEGLALRGLSVDPDLIVECGREQLRVR
jgi:hypothetical protein